MARSFRLQTISVLSAACLSGAVGAFAAPNAIVIAWSDLHGKVPAGLTFLVDSLRQAGETSGIPVVALDAGDAFFGAHLSRLTRGVATTAELNFLKPDAMTLGKGDFDWNRERLDSLLRVVDFPVVTANLRRNVDDAPIGGRRGVVLARGTLKVGVLGIGDPDLDYPDRQDRNGDMRVDPEEKAATETVAELRAAGATLVVALVHGGPGVSRRIGAIEGVDVVLSASDAREGAAERVGGTWVAQVPGGGSQVLRLELQANDPGWTASATTLPISRQRPLNAAWKAMDAIHDSLVTAALGQDVGTLKAAWSPTRREGPLGNWMADALRDGTGADLALVPASWIRAGFPKGKVRIEHVWNAIPPGLNLVSVFTLPGSDVMKFLERQMRRSKEYLFVSGLTCSPDSSMFGGNPIRATIGGKPLDKSAYYRIAIPRQLREDIYELTGVSESSAAPEWTAIWEADMVASWARKNGLTVQTGRVPAMYGGGSPK